MGWWGSISVGNGLYLKDARTSAQDGRGRAQAGIVIHKVLLVQAVC